MLVNHFVKSSFVIRYGHLLALDLSVSDQNEEYKLEVCLFPQSTELYLNSVLNIHLLC